MKKAILCMLAAGMIMPTAYAQEVTTSVNFDTRDVTVSGSFEEAAVNRMISIEVVEKDDPSSQKFLATIPSDTEGAFNYTFRMPEDAETGYYYINLGAYGMEMSVNEVYFAKKEDIDALLNIINTASSADVIRTEIEKNVDVLNISKDWYDRLDDGGKNAIAEALYNGRGSTGYASLSDATAVAQTELSVQAFRCADDVAQIEEVLEAFADVYNINAETAVCYELYNQFDEQSKQKALDLMAKREEVTDVISVYNEDILLTAVNTAKDPATIMGYLDNEEYREVITFSLNNYDSSDKEKTVKYLYNQDDFSDMGELEAAIENAIKEANDEDDDTPSRPSGGGGGTSSGSSGGITNYPPSTTGNNNNNENTEDPENGNENETEEVFSDISDAEWAREAILYLAENAVISGTGNGRFEPNETVTREQFTVMLVNAFELEDDAAVCSFEDLDSEHWAYKAVASAYEKGIVSGISETEFGTGRQISRQDMAVMAYKAAQAAGYEFENEPEANFTDIGEISEYALESVEIMSSNGIINGYPDGSFAPYETATRAQAAQVIYTLLK